MTASSPLRRNERRRAKSARKLPGHEAAQTAFTDREYERHLQPLSVPSLPPLPPPLTQRPSADAKLCYCRYSNREIPAFSFHCTTPETVDELTPPPARPPTPLRSSRYAGAFVLPLSPCSSAKSNPIHFDFPPRAASQSFLLRRLSLIGEDLLRHSLCSCRTKVFSFALMIITALYRNGISLNQSTAFIRSS